MPPYAPELEHTLRQFYTSLSEKDRRRYAGVEALKLGQGGRNYLARVLGCSRRTVTNGAREVSSLSGRGDRRRPRVRLGCVESLHAASDQYRQLVQGVAAGAGHSVRGLIDSRSPGQVVYN